MTVQYTYLFGEAIADWTDVALSARITSVTAEVIGPVGAGTNTTVANLFVEVIHDVKALAVTSVPILIACT